MQKNTSSFKKIALVIAVTGLFALVGSLIFFAYAEFLAANPMSLHETELFAFIKKYSTPKQMATQQL